MIYKAYYRDSDGRDVEYTRQIYASNEQRAIDELIDDELFISQIINTSTGQIVLDKEL